MVRRSLLPALVAALLVAVPARADSTAQGSGGAAASIDRTATQAAITALRQGGNAVDAAVTAAAVLGVTEPFSSGIGGGGFMVLYDAGGRRVTTIDSRESAPAAFYPRVFLDGQGKAINFDDAVTSGLSVGVPGTVRAWETALARHGTWSLRRALAAGIRTARDGFRVDAALHGLIDDNAERFADFPATAELYLRGDAAPPVGALIRNPDLAATYGLLARRGADAFYRGALARDIVRTVRRPPVRRGADRTVRPGLLSTTDLEDYQAIVRAPTVSGYRGYEVYGMAPPSSGGSTVAEALNILEGFDLGALPRADALHRYVEASKLAYADRGAYLGDPSFFDVPLRGLLSDAFADERRPLITDAPLPTPQPPGDPFDEAADASPSRPPRAAAATVDHTGHTTHLTVSDRDGNIVSYTFTIEQIGGNGMVVPGRGFLLNNELTDFDFVPPAANAPEAGKRPRSSMSPTIVLHGGRPVLALGAPGGSTIITGVLQTLVGRLDLGLTLPEAIAAPRVSSRNTSPIDAEQAFIDSPEGQALAARGDRFKATDQVSLVNGLEFGPGGRVVAAAEPVRGGGGTAMVQRPS